MASKNSYKKLLVGFGLGLGLALALSPAAREKIKRFLLEKSEDILPTIKEELDYYLDRISEAVAIGKAASQEKENEFKQMILRESHRID